MWLLNTDYMDKIYPAFYREYVDYTEIQKAQKYNLDIFMDELQKIFYNNYIPYADETGISQFEYILKIIPKPEETLEFRRSRVATRWGFTPPYTENAIKQWLDWFLGVDKWEYVKDYPNFAFRIISYSGDGKKDEELDYTMLRIKPCNMLYSRASISDGSNAPAESFQYGTSQKVISSFAPWVG